jgi:GT2 family glycosyltransferase
MAEVASPCRTTVVIITRNRSDELRKVLRQLDALPERPPVVVVDNGSMDATRSVVEAASARVSAVMLGRNAGAAGRNSGVAQARTPYVAFSDDDSWWAPGALQRAEEHFDRHPRLGLLCGLVAVGASRRVDPTCTAMQRSPLPRAVDLPGPSILGFVACGAVVRSEAFRQTSGFHSRFGVGGEETLLAIDLARRGWGLAYCDDVVAHHHPAAQGERPGRRARMVRNALWTTWLRRRRRKALAATGAALYAAAWDPAARAGLGAACAGLAWVLRERSPVALTLDANLSLLE